MKIEKEINKLWCYLFHRKHWWSNNWGTWHTSWDIHKGRVIIECLKCGKKHIGWETR